MSGDEFTFRTHLAHLIDHLRWAGTSVFDEMEKAGEIRYEERRALQYDFVRGINDAHLAMDDPKASLRCHERRHNDDVVRANMDGCLRQAVGKWLEYVLGEKWRTVDISTVQFPPTVAWLREYLVAMRKAMMVKPSEIRELLPVREERADAGGSQGGAGPG